MAPKSIPSEVVTVMFVDLAGFTKTTTYSDREKISQLQDTFDALTLPIFKEYKGKVIKKMGDAYLVTFKSPTNAVLCGIALQNNFFSYNRENPAQPLLIRVALHTGEVVIKGNDIYGDTVNITSRVEGIAKPTHIVFTEAVFLAMNKNEIPFTHLGMKKLRGLKYPVRLFKVRGRYDKILRKRKMRKRSSKVFGSILFRLLLLGVIGLIVFLIVWYLLIPSGVFAGLI